MLLRRSVALLVVSGSVFAVSAGGCGTSVTSLCEKVCECVGCNETERNDCIDEAGDAEKNASEADCGSEFDAYASCFDEEFECKSGNVSADGCETELIALGKCVGNGGPVIPGATVCDQLAAEAKRNGCATEDAGECDADAAKASKCYLDNSEDVCNLSASESLAIAECYAT